MIGTQTWPTMLLLAFLKTPDVRMSEKLNLTRRLRIRCPKCGWEPARTDTWSCNPGGCANIWNTFETRGVCPACSREWTETACLSCGLWSPHDDWYVEEDD